MFVGLRQVQDSTRVGCSVATSRGIIDHERDRIASRRRSCAANTACRASSSVSRVAALAVISCHSDHMFLFIVANTCSDIFK